MQKSLKKNCNWPLTLFILHISINSVTGKSLSETLILASVQYMKIAMSEHAQNMLCTQTCFCFDSQNNLCTQHGLSMFWAWNFRVLNL